MQLRDDIHVKLKVHAATNDTTLLQLISDAVDMYIRERIDLNNGSQ